MKFYKAYTVVKYCIPAFTLSFLFLLAFFACPAQAQDGYWWQNEDDEWLYYLDDNTLETDWQKIDGWWYWLGSDGVMQTGWQKINNTWYYLAQWGAMYTGWIKPDNTWYYLNGSGAMQTGWVKLDEVWYYLDGSGAMAQDSWLLLNNTWYFLTSTGAMHCGWLLRGNAWYYLDTTNGAMKTGWAQVDNTWYWLCEDGVMLTGWVCLGGPWFYLWPNGSMCTGWFNLNNAWYYFADNGVMATQWLKLNNTWYWLGFDGKAACNENLALDGTCYIFDSSCAWLETGDIPAETLPYTLTAEQIALIEAAQTTPTEGGGYCARWVCNVFEKIGCSSWGGNACDLYDWWCTSNKLSELKPGMIIAVDTHDRTEAGRVWGHVGIYIGDGLIIDDIGVVQINHLRNWLEYYGTTVPVQWGWYNGYALDVNRM